MPNDDAAQKLIEAILPKLTESLLPQLTAAVEVQIKGVLTKNAELVDKLGVEKDRTDKFAQMVERHEKQMKDTSVLLADKPKQDDKGPVQINRTDARDRRKYLAAVEEAKKRGTQVQITSDEPAPSGDTRTHVVTADKLYLSRHAARDRPTFKKLSEQAAREHLEFLVVSELPDAES